MGRYACPGMKGARFGRLTVIKRYVKDYISPKGYTRAQWLCRCDCGNEIVARGDMLRTGNVKSCGCLKTEAGRRNIKKANAGWVRTARERREAKAHADQAE